MFFKLSSVLLLVLFAVTLNTMNARPVDDDFVAGEPIKPWSKPDTPITWLNVGGAGSVFFDQPSPNSINFEPAEGVGFFG